MNNVLYSWDESRYITAHARILLSRMLKNMSLQKKEVRFLSVGDVLTGSGAKVISAPVAGLKTPSGKVEIGIEYPNGIKKTQIWGKYTVVGVKMPDTPIVVSNTDAIALTERSLKSTL